jgi:hypothetical protein
MMSNTRFAGLQKSANWYFNAENFHTIPMWEVSESTKEGKVQLSLSLDFTPSGANYPLESSIVTEVPFDFMEQLAHSQGASCTCIVTTLGIELPTAQKAQINLEWFTEYTKEQNRKNPLDDTEVFSIAMYYYWKSKGTKNHPFAFLYNQEWKPSFNLHKVSFEELAKQVEKEGFKKAKELITPMLRPEVSSNPLLQQNFATGDTVVPWENRLNFGKHKNADALSIPHSYWLWIKNNESFTSQTFDDKLNAGVFSSHIRNFIKVKTGK